MNALKLISLLLKLLLFCFFIVCACLANTAYELWGWVNAAIWICYAIGNELIEYYE